MSLKGKLSKTKALLGVKCRKHAPTLLFIGGAVAAGGAVICACRATMKVNDMLDERNEEVEAIQKSVEDVKEQVTVEEFDAIAEDKNKEIKKIKRKTALEVGLAYAPSVALFGFSMACFGGSLNILKKDNIALVGAYNGLLGAFKGYRERVKENFGEEVEKQVYLGTHKELAVVSVPNTNGDGVDYVEQEVEVLDCGKDISQISRYARFFDEASRCWSKDPYYNMNRLLEVQTWANQRLQEHGFVFLNEVYEALDLPKIKEGQLVGWCTSYPGTSGKIDFHIHDLRDPAKRRFVNGYENVILLDFNIDGEIIGLL